MSDRDGVSDRPVASELALGPLAGRYSTTQQAPPWWLSVLLVGAGFQVLHFLGGHGWSYYVGLVFVATGAAQLGQRFGLRASTELTTHGVTARDFLGRRTRVDWAQVTQVLPSRRLEGGSGVRLADGRRLPLRGVPSAQAQQLSDVVSRSRLGS